MRLLTIATFCVPAILIAGTPSEPNIISKLDECIQLRFLDGKSFGMLRILPASVSGHLTRLFAPENPAEQKVIKQLVEERYEVALYLAGRNPIRGLVQGPALSTPIEKMDELPPAAALLSDSRRAFAALEIGSGYSINKGEWTVAMRPLRAANERCVQCHIRGAASFGLKVPEPKVGDALGVAMYIYSRNR